MKYVLVSMVLASGLAHGLTCTNLPAGATALGYTTQLFYDAPNLAEVSTTDLDTTSKWYPGSFSHPTANNVAAREYLSTTNSELTIALGGEVSSETQHSTVGALPFLSGSKGFYVEAALRLSSNDSDHFIGFYLATVEHNLAKSDHLASDPAGYERWTEMDIAETGYGPGALESVINWAGIYPHYSSLTENNYGHDAALDFTVEHRYGFSYNPATSLLSWYIDDKLTYTKPAPLHNVIDNWHYFIVLEAGSHGSHVPYDMYVHYVTAYTK